MVGGMFNPSIVPNQPQMQPQMQPMGQPQPQFSSPPPDPNHGAFRGPQFNPAMMRGGLPMSAGRGNPQR